MTKVPDPKEVLRQERRRQRTAIELREVEGALAHVSAEVERLRQEGQLASRRGASVLALESDGRSRVRDLRRALESL